MRLSCECLVFSTTFGFGTGLGSWVGACTLLGPEGPGVTPLGVAAVPLGLLLLPLAVGVGTARTLRTTQWTRAS